MRILLAAVMVLASVSFSLADYSVLREEINCGMDIIRIGAPYQDVCKSCGTSSNELDYLGNAGSRHKVFFDRGWNGLYELNFVGGRLDEIREHYR
jgi:hypothetical protein